MKTIAIDKKLIGAGYPVFIIAELSANHHQDFTLAKEAIKLAKEAGADAIKLQTYTADSLTIDVKEEQFKAGSLWDDEYLYNLYQRAAMPYEWHAPLKTYADELGIILFSSPFDINGVHFLKLLGVPAYKIASFEITDIPLIRATAKQGKPIIISTGIATCSDIELAIQTCHNEGNKEIILLKCTSEYPAPPESMNLLTLSDMAQKFGVNVGLSDHTLGIEASIVAVSLGARVIEKHFTPNKAIPSADQAFSLDPSEFSTMVKSIRKVEAMLGTPQYGGNKHFSRSLYAVEDIPIGAEVTHTNIRSIRPGFGLHPQYFDTLIGQKARVNIVRGTPLSFDFFEEPK